MSNFSPSIRTKFPPLPICYFYLAYARWFFLESFNDALRSASFISSSSASFSYLENISSSMSFELPMSDKMFLTFATTTRLVCVRGLSILFTCLWKSAIESLSTASSSYRAAFNWKARSLGPYVLLLNSSFTGRYDDSGFWTRSWRLGSEASLLLSSGI